MMVTDEIRQRLLDAQGRTEWAEILEPLIDSLLDIVDAAQDFEDESENPPFPLSSTQAMRWVDLKKAIIRLGAEKQQTRKRGC